MTGIAPDDPLCVLVVDDCSDTTESLALLARAWGYPVLVANDGATALRLAAEHSPDVILLDIGMPAMSGWEVARQLRALLQTRGALLVALSGYAQADDQHRSLEAGCDLHLTKPPNLEELRALLVWRQKERRKGGP